MMTDDSFLAQICPSTPALWFVFHKEEILLAKTTTTYEIPFWLDLSGVGNGKEQPFYVGSFDNTTCYSVNLPEKPTGLSPTLCFEPIRQAHELLNNDRLFSVVARAKQLVNWDITTRFCGRCGHANQFNHPQHAKTCAQCQFMTFPHISPAMLVLIWREDELLLARSPQYQPGIYSILAGFVEPGETLEQTVVREVQEEVGIHIKNLHYVGSQPWPFPSSLMLGFTAEYASGELQFDRNELEDAQWFKLNQLPNIPKPISLSRIMIDNHLAKHRLLQPV